MHTMKRWIPAGIGIAVAAALTGGIIWWLQPALRPDTGVLLAPQNGAATLDLPDSEKGCNMRLTHRLKMKKPAGKSILLGAAESSAFALVKDEPIWEVELEAKDGKLHIRTRTPQLLPQNALHHAESRFFVRESGRTLLRMPNTDMHMQHHFILACELTITPPYPDKPRHSILMQELVVDLQDCSADLIVPQVPPSLAHLPATQLNSAEPTGLPERICGSAAEQEIQRFLFRLAAISDKDSAEQHVPALLSKGNELIQLHCGNEAWPKCWGKAAATVQDCAQRCLPLLQHMQMHDCYGSPELAEFINGPTFELIFGAAYNKTDTP